MLFTDAQSNLTSKIKGFYEKALVNKGKNNSKTIINPMANNPTGKKYGPRPTGSSFPVGVNFPNDANNEMVSALQDYYNAVNHRIIDTEKRTKLGATVSKNVQLSYNELKALKTQEILRMVFSNLNNYSLHALTQTSLHLFPELKAEVKKSYETAKKSFPNR